MLNSLTRYMIDVFIDGKILQMEVNPGAPCGIVSENFTLRKIKPRFTLKKSQKQFVSYTGHSVPCIGHIRVKITIGRTT